MCEISCVFLRQSSSAASMDAVFEVLSKPSADRTEEDIGTSVGVLCRSGLPALHADHDGCDHCVMAWEGFE